MTKTVFQAIQVYAIALGLLACAGKSGINTVTYIDHGLMTQYIAFRVQARDHGVDASAPIVMLFGNDGACIASGGTTLAGCCTRQDGQATVTINQSIWNTLNADDRELLVFHELGHCLLGRAHRTDTDHGVPESIMYPSAPGGYLSSAYPEYKNAYLNELFGETSKINFGW